GKSRLVEELMAHITRLPPNERPLWLEGRSLSKGARLPFWLFVDLLSPYIGGSDNYDLHAPIEGVQRIVGTLTQVVDLGAAKIERIARVIDHIAWPDYLEDTESVETHRDEHEALSLLFRAISHRRPLVLLFDDLQWADPESMGLVQALVGELKECPILIVCLHREDSEGKGARVATLSSSIRPDSFTEISLRRLTDATCAEILRACASSVSIDEPTTSSILRLAAGNPLFVSALASRVTRETAKDFQDMAQAMGGVFQPPVSVSGKHSSGALVGVRRAPTTRSATSFLRLGDRPRVLEEPPRQSH
ncbi:MAG TPA: AAA family ATPase, partial [Spirochaetia bacterium]|nr:AAA family ATPase [Spirochaetia bacterium]